MPVIAVRKRPSQGEAPPLPLENGDSMTSAEFLRRAEAWHELERVELIDGIVYMSPPLNSEHGESDGILEMWLGHYAAYTPELRHYLNTTLLLGRKNTVQPDGILCTAPRPGGTVWFDAKKYLCGAPELVCEIANSSVSMDLHAKLQVYRRAGIREYLVWRVQENGFDWFVNESGRFVPQKPDGAGLLRSRFFPGLVLDLKALLAHDRAAILRCLDQALARLKKGKGKSKRK